MEDTEDDWLFDSIKKYRTLLMFDLHNAATSLTWVSDKSVCVSTEGADKHEILELSLPEKILTSKESEGLCSDRDFRMISGGFSTQAVKEIRHIPNSRTIAVTGKKCNSLTLWKLGDASSDLIEQTTEIENPKYDSCPATLDVSSSHAVFGSKVNDVCVVDTTTNTISSDTHDLTSTDLISQIFFVDDNVLLAGCRNKCQVWRFDQREGLDKGELSQPREVTEGQLCDCWTYDMERSTAGQRGRVVSLGTSGQVVRMDGRSLDAASTTMQLAGLTQTSEFQDEHLTVKVSPKNPDVLSVSGLDSSVHLYNVGNGDCHGKGIQPEFSHQGHMACTNQSGPLTVTSHMWHPWQPDLLLSSASDGSLHAWQREFFTVR